MFVVSQWRITHPEKVDVNFLVEVDKLIQLLESPIFVYVISMLRGSTDTFRYSYLRLQLLEPREYSHLIKCLYGLLMLLPQVLA